MVLDRDQNMPPQICLSGIRIILRNSRNRRSFENSINYSFVREINIYQKISLCKGVSHSLLGRGLPQISRNSNQWRSEVKWKLLSHVWLFATPWTIQSMEFSRPEDWSGELFLSPDLPNPDQGLNPDIPHCRQILYQLSHQGSPRMLE